MTPQTHLRLASPVESHDVAAVLIESRHAAFPAVPESAHPDGETRQWVRDHLMRETSVWVAAAPSDDPVAVMALRDGWLEQLYVLPNWSGQGIGSQLLELAKEQNPAGLQLWTFVSNAAARAFYEKRGFVVVEQTDGASNEEREPDLRMVWRP